MCMIAHRPIGKKGRGSNMPNDVITSAMRRHPDGFGIAWRDPEKGITYEKFGPRERDDFYATLKAIDVQSEIEYVAHFRYATHGPEDADHAHPYIYDDPDPKVGKVLVFHNGIISGVKTQPNESDTEVFVRDYLAKLPSRWWKNAGIRKLVDHMGGWSRLVLMTNDETVNLNWWQGEEDNNIWYSSDHKPVNYAAAYWNKYDDDWDEEGTWIRSDEGWTRVMPDGSHVTTAATAIGTGKTTSLPSVGAGDTMHVLGETTEPRSNAGVWMHLGHELNPLQTFDFSKDGDYEYSIVCDTCGTCGDVYVIDGKAYVDIPHSWNVKQIEDDKAEAEANGVDPDEALLPEGKGALIPMNAAAAAMLMN